MAKIVFIAHPITGDIKINLKKVIEICKKVHSLEIIPIFPSYVWRKYLGSVSGGAEIAEHSTSYFFKKKIIDELWLYGDFISAGMKKNIKLAIKYDIPIIVKSHRRSVHDEYKEFLETMHS